MIVQKTFPIKNKPTDKHFNKLNKSTSKSFKVSLHKAHKEATDRLEEQMRNTESHNINLIMEEVSIKDNKNKEIKLLCLLSIWHLLKTHTVKAISMLAKFIDLNLSFQIILKSMISDNALEIKECKINNFNAKFKL